MFTELILAGVIVAVCVMIHVSGLMMLAEQLAKRVRTERVNSLVTDIGSMIVVFGIIVLLHAAETAVWAVFYQTWQLFPNFETSLYFSLTTYTAIGFGDVVLPEKWRLLGGVEGISGLLLCGLSTAFLFLIISTFQQNRHKE
jgi:voltage-gated potassium channel